LDRRWPGARRHEIAIARPCLIDAPRLALLCIAANTFREIANEAVDGQTVIDQVAAIGAGAQQIVNFDPVQLNDERHPNGSQFRR
jgi:hypothetical protein